MVVLYILGFGGQFCHLLHTRLNPSLCSIPPILPCPLRLHSLSSYILTAPSSSCSQDAGFRLKKTCAGVRYSLFVCRGKQRRDVCSKDASFWALVWHRAPLCSTQSCMLMLHTTTNPPTQLPLLLHPSLRSAFTITYSRSISNLAFPGGIGTPPVGGARLISV